MELLKVPGYSYSTGKYGGKDVKVADTALINELLTSAFIEKKGKSYFYTNMENIK